MLDPAIETFLAVAECGSFTKAARQLYISPTAVMKQINALEQRLGLTLLARTAHGVQLTAAGEVICKDAKFMQEYARRSLAAARAAQVSAEHMFCVGTSLLNPAKPFMDLWQLVGRAFPDYSLHLVPFEDDHRGIVSEIAQLGEKFDFLVAVCNSKTWLEECNMLPLGCCRMMVSMRHDHPLARKELLQISDLHGQTLMMVAEGDSQLNDNLRHDLQQHHPQVHIEDTAHFYDLSVFNRCAETDNLLLTLECWQNVHPALVTLPVEWEYSNTYGLLYAKDPCADVQRFVQAASEAIAKGGELP